MSSKTKKSVFRSFVILSLFFMSACQENVKFRPTGSAAVATLSANKPTGSGTPPSTANNVGAPPAGSPRTNTTPYCSDKDKEDEDDKDYCGSVFGVNSNAIRIMDNQNSQITVAQDDVVLVKVDGDHSSIGLQLRGATGVQIKGVCAILSGDHPSIRIEIGVKVKTIAVFERGNDAQASLLFEPAGEVNDKFIVDQSGNNAYLNVLGKKFCPTSIIHGNNGKIDC